MAASTTRAEAAVLLTGRPWGPTPGRRWARNDSGDSQDTVPPAVATASSPLVAATPPRNARRSARSSGGTSAAARARRVVVHFAPMCTTSAPTMIHAAQRCAFGKKNAHGYHRAVLAMPETRRKTEPPTSGSRARRSRACPIDRTGGHSTSFGATTHSLARRRGTVAKPVTTCRPWVTRYSPAGRDGSVSHDGSVCSRCEYAPVRAQIVNANPRATPSRAATRSSWSGLVNRPCSDVTTAAGWSLMAVPPDRTNGTRPCRTRRDAARPRLRESRPPVDAHHGPGEPRTGAATRLRPAR